MNMDKYCVFCGAENVDGQCPNEEQHLKKMCLNCASCCYEDECDSYFCHNEENKEDAMKKMLDTLQAPAGYSVTSIELQPLPLKDATKKCRRYQMNKELLMEAFKAKLDNNL